MRNLPFFMKTVTKTVTLNPFQHLYPINEILFFVGMTNEERINLYPYPKL